ncbi:MAG: hypothetical protein ACRCV3_03220 [Desulfovibrionaceae bacterium]
MSVESIVQDYGRSLGIEKLSFDSNNLLSVHIQDKGIFSFERVQDGIFISFLEEIPTHNHSFFMKEALAITQPKNNEYSLRPLLYQENAGLIMPLEEHAITLQSIENAISLLYSQFHSIVKKLP